LESILREASLGEWAGLGTTSAPRKRERLKLTHSLSLKSAVTLATDPPGLACEGVKALRAQAPRSSPAAIRRLVEEELRAPIDTLFAEWSDAPLASASIGRQMKS